ncbi:T9SS type A sorting domain-containing protein [bacterium]|nr:T9SS type A sorting domain-containing protein [bacterium]
MFAVLLICFPLMGLAQSMPLTDKPCGPICAHSRSAERWTRATLDAESLHTYDQLSLILQVSVEDGDFPMVAIATIDLVARETLAAIPFNAEGLSISEVTVNGQVTAYSHVLDTLHVLRGVAQAETVTVTISYSASPNPNWYDTGFQTAWEHCYTFSEPYGARRWYPCWDQPSDKFSEITMVVETPEHWTLAANGYWQSTTFPHMGRVTHTYYHDRPISPYLVMFAAGNFSNQVFLQNGIEYRYFAWPRSDSMKAAYDWERTPEMVESFSGLFGDYPFAEYGMVMTDIFGGWGAMEHQTFTTYGFNLVDSLRTFEGIVAHELAHQWFGDHLSPVDFRHMWLNEGFATYGDALWNEYLMGDSGLNNYMAQAATYCINEERHNPPSYPVYDPPEERLFGTNVYYKGAWVLHMLRKQLLGDSVFFDVLRDYVATFAGGNVSTQDFIDKVNEHYAGPDVGWFFDQWVFGLSLPVLYFNSMYDNVDHLLWGRVSQLQSGPPYFTFPVVIQHGQNSFTETDTFWVEAGPISEFIISSQSNQARLAPYPSQITLYEPGIVNVPEPHDPLPAAFGLLPAYPNPFNPSVTIPFSLARIANVKLALFDVTGRRITTIFEGFLNPGEHRLHYDAPASLGTGVYLLRAESGGVTMTQKLLLLK